MVLAVVCLVLIIGNVVLAAGNVPAASQTDPNEQIEDFVMTALLLRDVKRFHETAKDGAKAPSSQFMHNLAAVVNLADQTMTQIDSASAPVKTLFQKIFALKFDKQNREKEREAEIAEIKKVFGKLTDAEQKEILTLHENYEKKAHALGLEDLLLTTKD
ncbi:hypothetical protein ANCCAN_19604 [Ancylostoma caninum]|uniref:Nematode fatty acid retinoid binding protein n=1 Tax=Ancylostoma caninum TaxID=29170 RepID=A0A368FR48_ANCCA|nr:hypothetical protein ANCCAN_19604 [Ancylostoma caninum]